MSKIKPLFFKILPYFLAFFIPTSIFLGTLFIMPLFGVSRSILFQDPNNQYIDFLNYYKTFFQDPSRLFYSFSAGIGSNMVPLAAYYLLSPFNLLVLLFPNELVGYAYLLIVLLKIGFLGLTSYIFFRKNNNQEKTHYKEIIFSLAYSLSAFVICYFFHFEWLDALILLPIICLGINKIITDKKPWLYIIALMLSIIINYYTGFMLCIFSVLWFLYQYLLRAKLCQLKSHLKEFWQFIWASLLSGGVSAIIVIPTICSVFSQASDRMKKDIFDIATQFPIFDVFSQFTSNFIYGMPYLFAGTIITILTICYFLNQSISKKERILSGGMLAIFLISFNTPLLNTIWHGFSMTHGAPYRYAFITTFFLIYLAYKGFCKIKNLTQKRILAVIAIYIITYILVFRKTLDFKEHILLILDFTIAAIVCLLIYKNKTTVAKKTNLNKAFIVLQVINIVVLMLFNWAFLETVEGGVTSFFSSKQAITEITPIIDSVKEYDESFYRLEKTFNRTSNDGFQFDYFGSSLYSSSASSKLKRTFSELGMDNGKHYATNISINRNYEPLYGGLNTCTATSILGIKYIVSHMDISKSDNCKYEEVVKNGDKRVYKNNYSLPIIAAVSKNDLNDDIILQESDERNDIPKYLNKFANLVSQNGARPIKTLDQNQYNAEYFNLNVDGNTYTKINPKLNGYIIYRIKNQSKDNVYFSTSYSKNKNLNPNLIGINFLDVLRIYKVEPNQTTEDKTIKSSTFLNLGNDTEIVLKIEILVDKITLNQEVFFTESIPEVAKMYKGAREQKTNLRIDSQTHLSGEFNIEKEDQALLLTIPYDEGWSVYVDGKKIDTNLVMGDFMATTTTINPGKHSIELKFVPQGLICGIIISSVSLTLLIIIFITNRRKK